MGHEKIDYSLYLINQGATVSEAAEKSGMTRMTPYRKVNQSD
ncbi:hypothetical protein [Peribacillus butanolivorans]|nr:hypothetical protein [Peribacillus butanolivorans]